MTKILKNTITSYRRSDIGRWATIKHKTLGNFDGVLLAFEPGAIRGYKYAEVFIPNLGVRTVDVYDVLELGEYVKDINGI